MPGCPGNVVRISRESSHVGKPVPLQTDDSRSNVSKSNLIFVFSGLCKMIYANIKPNGI